MSADDLAAARRQRDDQLAALRLPGAFAPARPDPAATYRFEARVIVAVFDADRLECENAARALTGQPVFIRDADGREIEIGRVTRCAWERTP